ncbi:MAG: SlyX protein [Cycloclasticus sp. symbiont of Poecilosclerida sp. N]|nr:MAG: SlyX protein [Cycloclasticus sp. symbiont of Poecilosclerida sp. N]
MNTRITELEIKVAYQEYAIQQLDSVICRQQEQIDSLQKQLNQLKDAIQNPSNGEQSLFNTLDDVPPHY